MSKLIFIHPINENLRFLRKLIRKLRAKEKKIQLLRLSNHNFSHIEALTKIKDASEDSLVCFLGHGATKALYGCTYRYENHPEYYDYRNEGDEKYFIDQNNIGLLQGKKLIALSCNSITLGKPAIENGIKSFLGFTEINFDNDSDLRPTQKSRHYVEAKVKFGLRSALFKTISCGIEHNLTLYEVLQILKISIHKESDNLILNNKEKEGFKYYRAAADCLQELKSGIHIFGDGNEILL